MTNEHLLAGSILERQIETETQAVHAGVLRYRELAAEAVKRGDGAGLKSAERMLVHWWQAMVVAVQDEIHNIRAGASGYCRATAGPVIVQLDAEPLAYITLHQATSACMAEPDGALLRSVAYAVGSNVIAELHLRAFRKDDRETWQLLTTRIRSLTARKVNRWAKKKLDAAVTGKRIATEIGGTLLGILVDTCHSGDWLEDTFRPSFLRQTRRLGPKNTQVYLRMSEEVHRLIDEADAARETMRPRYLPMLVKPYPWTDKSPGGYVRIRTPFISKPNGEQKKAIAGGKLERVRECLDAVGATPWRINRRVLEVVEELWKSGGGVPGVPHAENMPIPPRVGIESPEDEKRWRRDAAAMHRHNARLRGRRNEFVNRLSVARQFAGEDAFYFPHQFDFRSRTYPVPVWLNHQGDDVCRGLLEFSHGAPVMYDDRRWVEIHAANCWGVDKVSFDDRAAWVKSNDAMITEIAKRPLDCLKWQEAENPFQFLAACFALRWADAEWHIPVQLDGTCNGLQHYAAMTRDLAGAQVVNLVKGDRPESVYTEVAAIVAERVRNEAATNPLARAVDGKIDRKIVKRVVMTAVYGVTDNGAASHVREALEEAGIVLEQDVLWKLGIWLGKVILESLGDVCRGAVEAMEWIRESARLITMSDRFATLRWTTPIGFPVVQPYRKWKSASVETLCGSIRAYDHEDHEVRSIRQRQINGSAPNFVHSVDATHMLQSALACSIEGIAFAAVHDSFWTHAASCDKLNQVVRNEFARLHEFPLLEVLRDQWADQHPTVELPPLPKLGTYDPAEARSANYLIA